MLKDRAATQRASIEHEFQIGKKSVTRNLLFRRKLARHGRLDFLSRVRQCGSQVYQLALRRNPHDVFDAHTQLLFRDVNSRLNCEHCTARNRGHDVTDIVHFQSDVMAQTVNEVLAQWLAVEVLAV